MAVRMGIHAGLDRVEDPAERLDELANVREFERVARSVLDPVRYERVAGGARDERTVRENERGFARIGLVPRVLRGVREPALGVDLLGTRGSWPVVIAPTACHGLAHPDAERATARAAAATGTIMIAAAASTVAIEDIAAEARTVAPDPALWFQLCPQPDHGPAEAAVRRAEDAGVRAFVLTVDADAAPGLSWRHVDRLRGATGLPIVLKGILHPDDARLGVEHGADGLIVSNHGGRGLDAAPPTIDRLPPLADAVAGRIPLLLGGGVRRGTDVVKALALGASAVAVGRPVVWGLATAGDAGVRRVLDLLRTEVAHTMILCGCPDVRAVPHDLAVPGAIGTAPS
ncbi:MAG TPA: alpha-hydroxy-acid oxidizing protein [Streptosporangiaceae bacterium]|jgi:4-hydroxymandelate oxidase